MAGGDELTINGNILTADDSKVLKKGDVIAVTDYLGGNDSAGNWTEIDKPDEDIPADEALAIITGGTDI